MVRTEFFGSIWASLAVSMLVEMDYQRVRCIHITASWQMKCGHGISIISNRRWWFFLLIAMYSYRHRGTVSITKSAIDIPVVGQKDVNFAGFAKWKDPKIISKMAILMSEESISIAKNFLGGWRWCLHPKGILFRLSRRRFSKDTTKLQMHNMPIRNLNQGVTANNCTSLLRKALSRTTSWLDPTGICNLSLITCSMCFTWSGLHSFVEISNTSYNTKLIS